MLMVSGSLVQSLSHVERIPDTLPSQTGVKKSSPIYAEDATKLTRKILQRVLSKDAMTFDGMACCFWQICALPRRETSLQKNTMAMTYIESTK